MSEPRPTRRDLLKPVQLLGFGFAAALFSGLVTLLSMGFFQELTGDERVHVVVVSLIVAGIAFIVTLVLIALCMLAVDPAKMGGEIDHGVLMDEPDAEDAAATDDGSAPRG